MKIATTIVRILFGLLFIFSSLVVLLDLVPQPELEGDMARFTEGLEASGYMMPLVKIVELLCGIAFLVGRFVPLATVVIFPIVVNILLIHIFIEPAGLALAVALFAANLFLAFACRKHYRSIFAARI